MFPDAARATALAAPADPPPATPDAAALCGLTVDDFHALLMDLLPRGAAWPRIPGTVLWNFWLVPADVYALVHSSDCYLLAEAYPCGAVDLLPEWERMVGLPDECTEPYWPLPLVAQQTLVCAKLAMRGGQSRAYFIDLAARWGFTITITEHPAWRLGIDRLCEGESGPGIVPPVGACMYWWEVNVTAIDTICPPGDDVPPEDCWTPDPALLECIIRRDAPAHTLVTFNYPPAVEVAHVHDARQ